MSDAPARASAAALASAVASAALSAAAATAAAAGAGWYGAGRYAQAPPLAQARGRLELRPARTAVGAEQGRQAHAQPPAP